MIFLMLIHIMLQFTPTTNNIINGSYSNITSFTQLYQLTNSGTGGLEGTFMMLLLFFVFTIGGFLAGRINPMLSALGSALIMIPISLLGQGIGLVNAVVPLVFVGLAMLTIMINLLAGVLRPYE